MLNEIIVDMIGEIRYVEYLLPNGSTAVAPEMIQILSFILLLFTVKYLIKGLFSTLNLFIRWFQ